MLDFLIRLVSPIFENMGVNPSDVATYVHMLSGYIYGILIAILVMIVLLIVAHWIAKKGSRHVVRWGAVVAWPASWWSRCWPT